MRHGKAFNHLSRKKGHRVSLLRNLAISLIKHKRINTTLAKAKALRAFIEPLITKSKNNTTHSRRIVFSYLQNNDAITELFGAVSAKVAERPGGYTRVIRTGFRLGDAAEMAMIELVDYNTEMISASKSTAPEAVVKKTRRSRGKKKSETDSAENAENSTQEETNS
ncbi:MAG: 50S ribosomal protein L17 [Saprospiraceae bacterium]|nr:50S ribosomal protein L17 [Saprospiraceae bacterium]